ncbi:hypothetical protein B5G34_08745 [Flavonifractor sp. An82]|uniref:DUF3048 domain-containing protein n=1 Tax=Flavonifractor sp. An82 TaxID=1965660 RepID=UPI000B3A9509|nr:DUF3048 domain-containing protein [Flavonifractor sp. An82]OUN22112.1 hypothetical protein B5G34_08745 [Flavonifractor sp. An82]
MGKKLLPLLLTLPLLLSACGGTPEPEDSASPSPSPAPTVEVATPSPTPYDGPVNPLTGLPIGEEWVNRRPVAIMLNNLKQALPQLGQSQADIIYEIPAEGGITRMVGVYQSLDGVGTIGSIRSARPYYLEVALGHDAIFLHAGGSEDAYSKISQWGVTALDAVRGPYLGKTEGSNLMWRDPVRRQTYSLEHTVVTTGQTITDLLPTYNIRLDHKEGYTYEMEFAEDGTPADGVTANQITVPVSTYKTGRFVYNEDTGKYGVEEYGSPYIDGNTQEQVEVTNVVILKTACRNTGDYLGHITVDLSSGGRGYFACGGKITDLTWSKQYPNGQFHYTDSNGDPITFGAGTTYVCIVPTDCDVSFS